MKEFKEMVCCALALVLFPLTLSISPSFDEFGHGLCPAGNLRSFAAGASTETKHENDKEEEMLKLIQNSFRDS